MARHDVYPDPDGDGYLLDVQTDFLQGLNVRIVVPLRTLPNAPKPARRLNPIFLIGIVEHVMVTQFLAAIPEKALKNPVTHLRAEADTITTALDMLLQGF